MNYMRKDAQTDNYNYTPMFAFLFPKTKEVKVYQFRNLYENSTDQFEKCKTLKLDKLIKDEEKNENEDDDYGSEENESNEPAPPKIHSIAEIRSYTLDDKRECVLLMFQEELHLFDVVTNTVIRTYSVPTINDVGKRVISHMMPGNCQIIKGKFIYYYDSKQLCVVNLKNLT